MKLRIKEVAKSKGYSMKELANLVGVIPMTLSNYQTGKRNVGIMDLKKIANVLDCEISELIPLGDKFYHSYNPDGKWKGILENRINL